MNSLKQIEANGRDSTPAWPDAPISVPNVIVVNRQLVEIACASLTLLAQALSVIAARSLGP